MKVTTKRRKVNFEEGAVVIELRVPMEAEFIEETTTKLPLTDEPKVDPSKAMKVKTNFLVFFGTRGFNLRDA